MGSSFLCRILAAVILSTGGVTQAAVLNIAAGQTQSISGTHAYDSVNIDGWLTVTDNTTIVSYTSFFLGSNGHIASSGDRGSDGTDGTLIHWAPGNGGNGSSGKALVIRAAGGLSLLGVIDLSGWNGGDGGDAYSLSNLAGGDGGNGGNGGNLLLHGDGVIFGTDFAMYSTGGMGGAPGAGGVSGGYGWGGDAGNGGNVTVEFVQSLQADGESPHLYLDAGIPGAHVEYGDGFTIILHPGASGRNGSYTVTQVPEPATLSLLALCLMGLALPRRRRRATFLFPQATPSRPCCLCRTKGAPDRQ